MSEGLFCVVCIAILEPFYSLALQYVCVLRVGNGSRFHFTRQTNQLEMMLYICYGICLMSNHNGPVCNITFSWCCSLSFIFVFVRLKTEWVNGTRSKWLCVSCLMLLSTLKKKLLHLTKWSLLDISMFWEEKYLTNLIQMLLEKCGQTVETYLLRLRLKIFCVRLTTEWVNDTQVGNGAAFHVITSKHNV